MRRSRTIAGDNYKLRTAAHVAEIIFNLMRRRYDLNCREREMECNLHVIMTEGEFKYLAGRKSLKKSFITEVQQFLRNNNIRLDQDLNSGEIRCTSQFDITHKNSYKTLKELEIACHIPVSIR